MTSNVHLIDRLGELSELKAQAVAAYEALRDQAQAELGLGKHEGERYVVSIFNSKGQVLVDAEGKAKLKELTSPQYYAAHTSQAEFVVVKPSPRKGVVR